MVLLSWFEDYLKDRHQYTVFNTKKSTITTVNIGVPQGNVLGPLLFLIYINDISDIFMIAKNILYADDMTLYLTNPNLNQLLHQTNYELNKLYNWCLCNRLTINTKKTYFMLFTTKKLAM